MKDSAVYRAIVRCLQDGNDDEALALFREWTRADEVLSDFGDRLRRAGYSWSSMGWKADGFFHVDGTRFTLRNVLGLKDTWENIEYDIVSLAKRGHGKRSYDLFKAWRVYQPDEATQWLIDARGRVRQHFGSPLVKFITDPPTGEFYSADGRYTMSWEKGVQL